MKGKVPLQPQDHCRLILSGWVLSGWALPGLILSGLLMVAGCSEPPAEDPQAQGFAGLGSGQPGYAEAGPDHGLDFPLDHGPHPDFKIEWWYMTANLSTADGQPFGMQWTLFRQALTPPEQRPDATAWSADQLWMAHMAVSSSKAHRVSERFARSHSAKPYAPDPPSVRAGVASAPFNARLDDWTLAAVPGHQGLEALKLDAYDGQGEARFGYSLAFEAQGPLVTHGENGFNPKTPGGQGSMYYSQPFYDVSGEVLIDGKTRRVSGQAWLDREWSSQLLSADQAGWDWFSLHLADGRKLMAYQLRSDIEAERGRFHHLISATGKTLDRGYDQAHLVPVSTSRVAGRDIPTEWQIQIPDADIDLVVSARHADRWMNTSIGYWEGDVMLSDPDGQDGGVGYLEMTGY